MSKRNDQWLQDYQEFLANDTEVVPVHITNRVQSKISTLLNPNPIMVFFKIFAVHVLTGFLSLSVCHQFGLNPFNTEYSLADWYMKVGGHQLCMFGCGITFVGISILFAGYFLTIEEVRALRKSELLFNLTLGLISIGVFAAFGVEMALGIAGIWLLGVLLGGITATQFIWVLKKH